MLSSRTDTERAAIVFTAWNGTRRSANDAGLRSARIRSGSADPGSFRKRTGQTPVSGADGSSECPGDSSHERGEVGASDRSLGHLSKPTNPSVCGTQVKSCVRGPGSVRRLSHVGLNHRRRCRSFSNGTPGARLASGRPRKRLFTRRSARPVSGKRRLRRPACPVAEMNTGRRRASAIRMRRCLTIESAIPGHCRA